MAINSNINNGNMNLGRASTQSKQFDDMRKLLEEINQSNKSINEQLLYKAEREYEEQNRDITPLNNVLNAFNMGLLDNREQLKQMIAELKSLNEQVKRIEDVNKQLSTFFKGSVSSGVVEDYNTEISSLTDFKENFDNNFRYYQFYSSGKVKNLEEIVPYGEEIFEKLQQDVTRLLNSNLSNNDIINNLKSNQAYYEILNTETFKDVDLLDLGDLAREVKNDIALFKYSMLDGVENINDSIVKQFNDLGLTDAIKDKMGLLDENKLRDVDFVASITDMLSSIMHENDEQIEKETEAIKRNADAITLLENTLAVSASTMQPNDVLKYNQLIAQHQLNIDKAQDNINDLKAEIEKIEDTLNVREKDLSRIDNAFKERGRTRKSIAKSFDDAANGGEEAGKKQIENLIEEKEVRKEIADASIQNAEALGLINKREHEIKKQLDDIVEKRREEEALIRKGANRLATIKGIYHAIKETLGKALGIWMEYEDTTFRIARGMGLNREQAQALTTANIKNVEKLAIAYGVSKDAIMKLQQGITDATQRNIILTREQTENLLALSKIADEATVAEAVESGAQLGVSINDSMAKLALTQEKARAFGLNAAKASQAFAKNMHLASTYSFRNGTNGLSNMLLLSQKLRFNMESITSAADKFQDIEGSIETAAKIQMLGGSYARNFSNPMAIMYEATSDIESFTERIVRTVKDKGIFNRETGEVNVAPIDKAFIREFASAIGMSFDEVMKMVNSQVRNANVDNEINKNQNFSEIEKSFIETNAEWNSVNKRFELAILDQNGKEVGTKAVSSITKEDIDQIQTNTIDEKNMFKDTRQIRNAVLQIAKRQGIQMTSLSERKEGFQNATSATIADFTDSTGLGRGVSNLAMNYSTPAGNFLSNFGSTLGGVLVGGGLLGGLFRYTSLGRNGTNSLNKVLGGGGFRSGESANQSNVARSTNTATSATNGGIKPHSKPNRIGRRILRSRNSFKNLGATAKTARGLSKFSHGLGWSTLAHLANMGGKATGLWEEGSGADKTLSTVGDIGTGAMIGNIVFPGVGGIIGGALGGIYGVYKNFGNDIKGWFSGKDKKDEALAKKTEESGDAINSEFGSDSVYYSAATSILAMQDPLVRIASKNPTTVVRVTPQEQSLGNINNTTMEELASVSESFDTIQENISNITSSVGNIEQTTLSSTELLKEVNTNNVNLASTQMESLTKTFNDFISSDAYLASINTVIDNVIKNRQMSSSAINNNSSLITENSENLDTKIDNFSGDFMKSNATNLMVAYSNGGDNNNYDTSFEKSYLTKTNRTLSEIANDKNYFSKNGNTSNGVFQNTKLVDNNSINYDQEGGYNWQHDGNYYGDVLKTQYNGIFSSEGNILNHYGGAKGIVDNDSDFIYNFGGNSLYATRNGFHGRNINDNGISTYVVGSASTLFSPISNNGNRLNSIVYGRGDVITNNVETSKDDTTNTVYPIPNNSNTFNGYNVSNTDLYNGIEPKEPNIVPITNVGGSTEIKPSDYTTNNYNNSPFNQQQWQYMQPNNASMDVNINGTIRLQGDGASTNLDIIDLIERNPTLRSRIIEIVVDGMYRKFGYGRNYMNYNSIKQGGTAAPFRNA